MLRCLAVLRRLVRHAGAAPASRRRTAFRGSECLAMANAPPRAIPVSLRRTAAAEQVLITYRGPLDLHDRKPRRHAWSRPTTAAAYDTGRVPDVVTMNRAHSTHYTLAPGSEHRPCAARLGRRRPAGQDLRARRRRADPQRHHRHPPLFVRRRRCRHDQGRQFDLHLRGRGPVHRPSRPSAHHARRQPFRGDRPDRYSDGADRRQLHDVARRHLRHHQAAARLGGAADAPLHDAARRFHAAHRPDPSRSISAATARCASRATPCRARRR